MTAFLFLPSSPLSGFCDAFLSIPLVPSLSMPIEYAPTQDSSDPKDEVIYFDEEALSLEVSPPKSEESSGGAVK